MDVIAALQTYIVVGQQLCPLEVAGLEKLRVPAAELCFADCDLLRWNGVPTPLHFSIPRRGVQADKG